MRGAPPEGGTLISRDLRYAGRIYRRTPAFSAVATLVLAIAVAVATAVFSLYSHLALQPVTGVPGGDRFVSIGLARDANEWIPFSAAQFEVLAEVLTVPEALVATTVATRTIEVDGIVSEAAIVGVSSGFFRTLGVSLMLGTDLDAASAEPAAPMAVLSERFWREQYGARPGVIGAMVAIEDQPFTVVGVAGGGFRGFGRGASGDDLWIPVGAALESMMAPRMAAAGPAQARQFTQTIPLLRVVARLPAGVAVERLQQELDLVSPRLRDATDSVLSSGLMRLEALPGTAVDPRRHLMLVRQSQLLVAGAVLVLLVASLNLASFMLARGPGRLGELRTRLALGASAVALVRQLLVEAALLIGTATALGLLLHYWLRALLLRMPPFIDTPPGWLELQTDWRVAVFVVAAALVVTLIAGLLPAVRIAGDSSGSLVAQSALGRRGGKLPPLLVLQVAVATLVVLAGTLFLGEVRRLEGAPMGFDAATVLAGQLLVAEQTGGRGGIIRRRASMEQLQQFVGDLIERVSALPNVEALAFASAVPFVAPATNPGLVELGGVAEQPPEDRRRVYYNQATPELFRVLGARFVQGRPFDMDAPQEVVVSRVLARQLWGRDDVLGERLMPADSATAISAQGGGMFVTFQQRPGDGDAPREVLTVVGVVDDMRYAGAEDEHPPMLYRNWTGAPFGQRYVVRGRVDAALLHATIDELVRERFAPMRAEAPVPLAAAMRAALRNERARSRLALGAAAIALLLTIVGLYAAVQHMVDARRAELAVRKAIGASDSRLVRMILGRAGAIVTLGCCSAVLFALVFLERLEALLLGLDPLSAPAWAITLFVVAATGVAAAWLPALRAGRVDAAVALRYE